MGNITDSVKSLFNQKSTDKWDKNFLEVAKLVSTWSKDPSAQIGAVIVGDKQQIIAQGYNGFPRGVKDYKFRLFQRDVKYKYIIHAEMNALMNSIHNGANTNGATLYVSGLPVCHECAKMVIQAGIKRVIMDTPIKNTDKWGESGTLALSMFREAKVKYKFIEMSKIGKSK